MAFIGPINPVATRPPTPNWKPATAPVGQEKIVSGDLGVMTSGNAMYSYKVKQNPDKTYGINYYLNGQPVPNSVYAKATGLNTTTIEANPKQYLTAPLDISNLQAGGVYSSRGGGGGGISRTQQSAIDAEAARQKQLIQQRQAAFTQRKGKYDEIFAAQEAEMLRSKGAQEGDIAYQRGVAGKQAGESRTDLNTNLQKGSEQLTNQNIYGQAAINRLNQVAGTYDSSAREGQISTTQGQYEVASTELKSGFEKALKAVNENEADYYRTLDRQLEELSASYKMSKQTLDLTKFDNQFDFDATMQALDENIRQVDQQALQMKQSAIDSANTRYNAGINAQQKQLEATSKYYTSITDLADKFKYTTGTEIIDPLVRQISNQAGINPSYGIALFEKAKARLIVDDLSRKGTLTSQEQDDLKAARTALATG